MATLFKQHYTRGEILRRVGDISQVAGVQWHELQDGTERGVRVLEVRTGSGLTFDVVPDRGMDISRAEFSGVPIAWRSSTGVVAPWFYDTSDYGLLRSFHGGLLLTCGLVSMGVPSEDQARRYPMHGRASNVPAHQVRYGADWDGDEYLIWVEGKVRETQLFGENMELTRRITTSLGATELVVHDVVRNIGFAPEPVMMLYHMNFGFPLLDEDTRIRFGKTDVVVPRDDEARKGQSVHDLGALPSAGFREQVFLHDPEPDHRGYVTVLLSNQRFSGGQGLGVRLRYEKRMFPYLWQWRMLGEGTYVMGIEPANSKVFGRAAARNEGVLELLQPGEERAFVLTVEVLPTNESIDDAETVLSEAVR